MGRHEKASESLAEYSELKNPKPGPKYSECNSSCHFRLCDMDDNFGAENREHSPLLGPSEPRPCRETNLLPPWPDHPDQGGCEAGENEWLPIVLSLGESNNSPWSLFRVRALFAGSMYSWILQTVAVLEAFLH